MQLELAMGRLWHSLLLRSSKMETFLQIFWQVLLLAVMAQPSEEVEVLCTGTTCYTLTFGRHNWNEAQQNCKNNGGNLMTVKSQEEAALVLELLGRMPLSGESRDVEVRLWIGLHREKGKCYQQHRPLKGFSWVTGGEETKYSNWGREPTGTCLTNRCVTLQGTSSSSMELVWAEIPCSRATEGYLCKFSFQGMCRPLVLAGPGIVKYTTPFDVVTTSLVAVPFGSSAEVACGPKGEEKANTFLVCKPQANSNTSEWTSPGPFCPSSAYGCSYNNGGCEHDCLDQGGGLFQCACHSGYQLGRDQLSCVPVDYCSSNPCQGQCLPHPGGFTCSCSLGYVLADDGLRCGDVDECSIPQNPCEQICINTMGSFMCRCNQGYQLAGPGERACQDIDECATAMPCKQLCVNTPGSFLCSCLPGYELEGINSNSCLDVDECQEELCEHMCINNLGSYQCSCRSGWILAHNEISCILDRTSSTSFPPTQKEGELAGLMTTYPVSEAAALLPESLVPAEQDGSLVSQDSTLQPHVFSTSPDTQDHVRNMHTDNSSGNSKQLLYYTLGGVAIFLLLALILSGVTYQKMKAKGNKKKTKCAADHYSWVEDQGKGRAEGNEYM